MRLIYSSSDQRQTLKLAEFLTKEGIQNQCEIQTNRDWGSPNYGDVQCTIWVVDEDQLELAHRWIDEFNTHPENPVFESDQKSSLFELPPPPPIMPLKQPQRQPVANSFINRMGLATLYLLLTCTLIFFYGELTAPSEEFLVTTLPATPLYTPTLYKQLMYDYPKSYAILDKLAKSYGLEKLQKPSDLPPEGQVLLKQFAHTPYWQGIYKQLVVHIATPNAPWKFSAPLFEKIREGEIWRLVTPILLHANIFHLFFNMLWIIVLGKLIEERLGIPRYFLLIILLAIVSNTAQYLMSGANFLGISGVIVGMLGFIWTRQRVAAWEGYRLTPGVFGFMMAFILGVAAVQVIAFFQEAFWHSSSFPAIASTAHIVGGITGLALGYLDFFRMKAIIP